MGILSFAEFLTGSPYCCPSENPTSAEIRAIPAQPIVGIEVEAPWLISFGVAGADAQAGDCAGLAVDGSGFACVAIGFVGSVELMRMCSESDPCADFSAGTKVGGVWMVSGDGLTELSSCESAERVVERSVELSCDPSVELLVERFVEVSSCGPGEMSVETSAELSRERSVELSRERSVELSCERSVARSPTLSATSESVDSGAHFEADPPLEADFCLETSSKTSVKGSPNTAQLSINDTSLRSGAEPRRNPE